MGFSWAIRVVALLCAVSGILACCLLKKRLPPNTIAGGGRAAAVDLKSLVKEPKFALVTISVFLVEFAVFIPYTYISSYGLRIGLELRFAHLFNAFLNAGAIPGRALPGLVADTLGVYNVMVGMALLCSVVVLGLWLPIAPGQHELVIAFAILYGFFSGAAISLTPVCVGQMCRTEDYGKRLGTAFSVASIGALIGSPLAGSALDANDGSYFWLIIIAGAVYAAATVAFAVTRISATGWTLWAIF